MLKIEKKKQVFNSIFSVVTGPKVERPASLSITDGKIDVLRDTSVCLKLGETIHRIYKESSPLSFMGIWRV